MDIWLGFDIGGTKLMVASADKHGRVLRRCRRSTPEDLQKGLTALKEMALEVAEGNHIKAIGAAVGGPLDWQNQVVSPLHQPQWRGVPLKQIMEDALNCSFHLDQDVNLAALSEYHFGPEKPGRLLYITISTGVGGGFLTDGEVYRGMNGVHPESGHQAVPFRCSFPERIECACGVPDCLEALVSGTGIRRIYQKAPESLLDSEWEEVAYNLGQGLRNFAAIYLPDVVVLGGGVAVGGGERFVEMAREVMRKHLRITPVPRVMLSLLGTDTALMGAIVLALQASGITNEFVSPTETCVAESGLGTAKDEA